MYTFASYYHLKFKGENWTFLKAFLLAMPLVAVEYIFSLNGNHFAHTWLNMSAKNILILTMCFYFINLHLLNTFVLKHTSDPVREITAFILIMFAFAISGIHKPM